MRDYNIYHDLSEKEKNKLEIIHKTYSSMRTNITYDFNQYLINKYCVFNNKGYFWDIFKLLDGIIDLSDPDTSLPNSLHAFQTAEAIRKTNKYPDWFVLCGLIHDMGKILYMKGCDMDGTSLTTQWAIVGDTFITGCPTPDSIVLPQYKNTDKNTIKNNIGLKNVSVSFGHDEYMFRLLKYNNHKMPIEAEYIIRYHSLYAWHSGSDYDYIMDNNDKMMKNIVVDFNNFDLYTKDDTNNINMIEEYDPTSYYSNLVKKYISSDMMILY
jgi:inositol oxygenase